MCFKIFKRWVFKESERMREKGRERGSREEKRDEMKSYSFKDIVSFFCFCCGFMYGYENIDKEFYEK